MDFEEVDDINPNLLHNAFWNEWCRSVESISWLDYIKSKDLGVEIIGGWNKIVDEKKWALAKIKYGF